jgi:WD40 repeat protein
MNVNTQEQTFLQGEHNSEITCIALCNNLVVTGQAANEISIEKKPYIVLWDISDLSRPRALKKVSCHQSIITNVQFDQGGDYLVTIGASGNMQGQSLVALWKVEELLRS